MGAASSHHSRADGPIVQVAIVNNGLSPVHWEIDAENTHAVLSLTQKLNPIDLALTYPYGNHCRRSQCIERNILDYN